jgi:hypothetical protein
VDRFMRKYGMTSGAPAASSSSTSADQAETAASEA